MLVWNKKMYMDKKVSRYPSKYRKLAGKRRIFRRCYYITFPANSTNIMDIYSCKELWFKYHATQGLEVIGMASCEENAVELVTMIVQDIYKKYGDISPKLLREFFEHS